MKGIPVMHQVAAVVTALYGLVSLGGGIMGYAKGSLISLVAGGVAGILLLVCAGGIFRAPVWSLSGAIVIALFLAGRFAATVFRSQEALGELLNSTKGIIAVVMIAGGLLVIIVSALGLLTEAPK